MKKKRLEPDHIRKKTAMMIGVVMFCAGFFSGILLTVYKTVNNPQLLGQKSDPHDEHAEHADKTDAMEKALTAKIREAPKNADLWTSLGNLYFDSGRHKEAIGAYEKSVEIAPKNANVWTDLGVMYRRSGMPEKAVEAFDRAQAADASHETSLFNKGVVLLHDLKSPEAAIGAWKALLEINPMAMSPDGRTVEELVRIHTAELAANEKGGSE